MEDLLRQIRISAGIGENRFMIASGQALDREKQFYGTSVVVRTDALEVLGHMLNIEVIRY